MKIVFFGTSSFSVGILECLIKLPHSIEVIVTRPDRPQGRSLQMKGSAVKEFCLQNLPNVPLFFPEKASTEEFSEVLKSFKADLFVVVAYGEILKQNILCLPTKACINIHTSLLPKYRGAAPIQRCLMHGETISGVTFMEMALKMDAGDILKQEEVQITLSMNVKELEASLLEAATKALPDLLENFDSYYTQKRPQNEAEVTFAAKILPEDTVPNWELSARQMHDRIRALSPLPGVFIRIRFGDEVKRMKILSSSFSEEETKAPGLLFVDKNSIKISCKKGFLHLLVVQMEGKKALKVDEFLRGVSRFFTLQND